MDDGTRDLMRMLRPEWREDVEYTTDYYRAPPETLSAHTLFVCCGAHTWRVHAAVLEAVCPTLCGTATVGRTSKGEFVWAVTIDFPYPSAVGAMLEFCYGLDYFEDWDQNFQYRDTEQDSEITFSVRVFALATKYHIPTLASKALRKIEKRAPDWHWGLDFANAMQAAYSTRLIAFTTGLRKRMVDFCLERAQIESGKTVEFWQQHSLEDLLVWHEVPGFRAELIKRLDATRRGNYLDCRAKWWPGTIREGHAETAVTNNKSERRTEYHISCGGRTWVVDIHITLDIGPSSEVRMFQQVFGVPCAAHAMFRFLYTLDYDDCEIDGSDFPGEVDISPLLLNVHVHAMATKYTIPALALLASTKFMKLAETEYTQRSFARAVEEAYRAEQYEHTTRLREKIVDFCAGLPHVEEDVIGVSGHKLSHDYLVTGFLWDVAHKMPKFKEELQQKLGIGQDAVSRAMEEEKKNDRGFEGYLSEEDEDEWTVPTCSLAGHSNLAVNSAPTKTLPLRTKPADIRIVHKCIERALYPDIEKKLQCGHCHGKFSVKLEKAKNYTPATWCPFCGRTGDLKEWEE